MSEGNSVPLGTTVGDRDGNDATAATLLLLGASLSLLLTLSLLLLGRATLLLPLLRRERNVCDR